MKLKLQHSWVGGVKITPSPHNVSKAFFRALQEELGEKFKEVEKQLRNCFTEENGMFTPLYEINTVFFKTCYLPRIYMPNGDLLTEINRSLDEEFSRGLVTDRIDIIFHPDQQAFDIKWETKLPPDDLVKGKYARFVNLLSDKVYKKCRDYYSLQR